MSDAYPKRARYPGLLLAALLCACGDKPQPQPQPSLVQPTELLPSGPPLPVRPPLESPREVPLDSRAALPAPDGVPGDLDGDGKLDLLRSTPEGSTQPGLLLFRGRGDGTFFPAEFQDAPERWYVHEFGDVDRDGDLDFVSMADLRRPGYRLVKRTLLNDGTGRFAQGTEMDMSLPVHFYAPGISRLGEVDGDGALDVFTLHSGVERTRTYGDTLTVWRTAGTGSLSVRTDISVASSPNQVAAADLTGDGHTDFVVTSRGPNKLHIIDVKGFSGAPVSTRTLDLSYLRCSFGGLLLRDFNGDGAIDVAYSCDGIRVLLNNGGGSLRSAWGYESPGHTGDFSAADFNKDGRLDLVVNDGWGGPSLYLGRGDGSFRLQASWATHILPAASGGFSSTGRLFVEDFNRDGDLDILAPTTSPLNTRALLLSDGKGGLIGPLLRLSGENLPAHGFIDINADGAEDVLMDGRVFINAPEGELRPMPTAFKSAGGAAVLDLNGDGWSDVIGENALWLGDGKTLVYGSAVKGALGGSFTGRHDADNDGTPDLVFDTTFARGLGQGRFADAVRIPSVPGTLIGGPTLFADFNGDGALDLHTAFIGLYTCTPDFGCSYPSQGPGVCLWSLEQQRYECLEGNPPLTPLAALDLTGDGVVDLANATQLARGLGNGRFAEPEPLPELSLMEQVRLGLRKDALLGDVDADGRTDVVLFRDHDWIDVRRGLENGELAPAVTYFAPGFGWNARLVDLDDDGFPELVRPAAAGFAMLKLTTR